MSPITAQEAYDATNPNQTDEQRKASAQSIMSSVAANDAYINSRPELEQVLLLAKGGRVVAPPADGQAVETGNATNSTAIEDAPSDAKVISPPQKNEKADLLARLAELDAEGK